MPDIGDVIELIIDVPERNLRFGTQGTIVHCHGTKSYEVEFTDESGETKDFLALDSDKFITVWRAETHEWASALEQIAEIVARLPQETVEEVLDFTRFLSMRKHQRLAPKSSVVNAGK